MSTNKRILIAADASDASQRAAEYVAEMIGARPGYHVGLVHLMLPPRMLEWGGSEDVAVEDSISAERASAYRDMEKDAAQKGKRSLRGVLDSLAEKGIDIADLDVQFDEPLDPKEIARSILNTAKDKNYGTVVVGRHSFSGLKRLFQHHVGEELVRNGQGRAIWVVE